MNQAEQKLGISSQLIMCFLRHIDEDSAFETFKQALPYKDNIIAVANAHPVTENELAQFSINAVEASFISPHAKEDLIAQLRQYLAENTH